jgi:hypothetical protein
MLDGTPQRGGDCVIGHVTERGLRECGAWPSDHPMQQRHEPSRCDRPAESQAEQPRRHSGDRRQPSGSGHLASTRSATARVRFRGVRAAASPRQARRSSRVPAQGLAVGQQHDLDREACRSPCGRDRERPPRGSDRRARVGTCDATCSAIGDACPVTLPLPPNTDVTMTTRPSTTRKDTGDPAVPSEPS